MQHHFVIGYDTDEKKWFVESGIDLFFANGSVWSGGWTDNNENADWFYPDEATPEHTLDTELFRTLQHVINTIPIPEVV
jgi:hypothetical protein